MLWELHVCHPRVLKLERLLRLFAFKTRGDTGVLPAGAVWRLAMLLHRLVVPDEVVVEGLDVRVR